MHILPLLHRYTGSPGVSLEAEERNARQDRAHSTSLGMGSQMTSINQDLGSNIHSIKSALEQLIAGDPLTPWRRERLEELLRLLGKQEE